MKMKDNHNVESVWNEFSGQIRSYLLGKVNRKDDADDLLQDIFIKIHNNLGELKDEKKLAPWIHQIVRNSLTDYYRKKRLDTSEYNEDAITSDIDETDDEIFSACVANCINVFINRLPERYKVPLELSDIKGLKQKDIAKQMGLSYSGLKSRVQRGREMMKDMFIDCSCYIHQSDGQFITDKFDYENCEICNPKNN